MSVGIDRLPPLPENVLSLSASHRAWNGVRVDIAEFQCAGRVAHHLRYETETRLSVLLEEDDRSSERGGENHTRPVAQRLREL